MRFFDQELAHAKGYRRGTHRTRSPADTVLDYGRLCDRFGITRLANITGLDVIGMPVYVAVRPNSRGLSVSQGKGFDRDSAKASALMESIESWHGERIERPLRFESYRELRAQGPVVDVTEVPLRAGGVLRVDAPTLFVEAWDLLREERTWVPYEAATVNFVSPVRGASTFLMSTNGLASGNHLLEAISHGLCEVIERDTLTLWNLEGSAVMKQRQIDLATVDDPCCRETIDRLEAAGVAVAAWDITGDIGVPTCSCAIIERELGARWRPIGMFSGYGCHLSPEVALMRALSEAVQSRLTMIAGSRDDLFYSDYRHNTNEDDHRRLLAGVLDPPPAWDFRGRASLATDRFEDDVAVLLERVRAVGVESVAVVDLTRPDIGIPVVKVVVPGLEAMSGVPHYVPGRRALARMGRSGR